VGFHTPLEALHAALLAQEALLSAEWPSELVNYEYCAPSHAIVKKATTDEVTQGFSVAFQQHMLPQACSFVFQS
jgi:hypothetical protein